MFCPVCEQQLVSLDGRFRCPDAHGCMVREGDIIAMRIDGRVSESLSTSAPTKERQDELDCPSYSMTMERRNYKSSPYWVDACTVCDYMWFDNGESRKVLVETKL